MENHRHERSEYDLDCEDLNRRYTEVREIILSDADINDSERDMRLEELDVWYDREKEDKILGDGKSARMLVESGFADYVQP